MVMGHAHPKIVEAVQRARRAGHALRAADRGRADRGRAARRAHRPAVLAVRQLRAPRRRSTRCASCAPPPVATLIVKIEGTYHGHHDALMVSVFPSEGGRRPARAPELGAADAGLDPPARVDTVVNVPFNDADAAERVFAEHGSEIAGMIVEPDHDELRRRAARPRVPPAAEGHLPPARRDVRLRRGEDRVHGGLGRRDRGVRRAARPGRLREGDRRRPAVRRDRRAPRRRWAW